MGSAKAGVIGWPVSHSLSPKLFRYWLKTYNLQGIYEALAIPPDALRDAVFSMVEQGYAGMNVTLPHKEGVLRLVDDADEAAQAVGAVNMITVKNGKLYGTNTDTYGFTQNLKQKKFPGKKEKAIVLGAGGAARAVVKALADEGFKAIVISARTATKARAIADRIDVVSWEKRHAALGDADLLVNATSLGMEGQEPLMMDLGLLPGGAVVYDLVYRPLETELLQQAKARGNPVVDGLGMLIHQAVPAFEAWFGVKPEVDAKVRQHLLSA